MKKARLLALILAVLLVVSCAGCAGSNAPDNSGVSGSETGKQGGSTAVETPNGTENTDGLKTLHVGITEDPVSFAPWETPAEGRYGVLPVVYQMLFYTEKTGGELIGDIAESYEHTDDTHTVVKIKENVNDSLGNHLTAEDVVFSYQKSIESNHETYCPYVVRVEALDEYTVEFEWTEGFLDTCGMFTKAMCTQCHIVTKAAYEAASDGMAVTPVGTGPYVVKDYIAGSHITLVKNENFWWTENCPERYAQNIDVVEIDIIPEASQVSVALQTGAIDISNYVADADLVLFKEGGASSEGFTVDNALSGMYYEMEFNCSESSMGASENLRKAICTAVDVDAIMSALFGDEYVRIYCPTGSELNADYNMDWEKEPYYEFDLETAKAYLDAYLEETGKTADELNFRIIGVDTGACQSMIQILQGYILQLGINCTIGVYDTATYNSYKLDPTAWDVCLERRGASPYVVNGWPVLRSGSQDGLTTRTFIDDDKLEEMAVTATTVSTHTQEVVNELRDYVTEHCFAYGFGASFSYMVHSDNVTHAYKRNDGHIMYGACVVE